MLEELYNLLNLVICLRAKFWMLKIYHV